MCIKYVCYHCKETKIWRCGRADWYEFTPACPEMRQEDLRRKCTQCELIKELGHRLRVLVFRHPCFETEGKSGLQEEPDWMSSPVTGPQIALIDWRREADNELMDRIMAMGLGGLEGHENLNDGHGLANGSDSNNNNNSAHDQDGNMSTNVEESHEASEETREGDASEVKEEQNNAE